MRQRFPGANDYAAIRRGFVDAGLDADFYNGEEIAVLWQRCYGDRDRIVAEAVAYARRSGSTAGVQLDETSPH